MTNLKLNNNLDEIAKYMQKSVNKHNWDFKDLIHYFEQDNGFDYRKRVILWEQMNMFETKKTYKNIHKFLTKLVEINLVV